MLDPDARGAVVGGRVRTLILAVALVAVGVFAGSALSQWWEVPGSQAAVGAVRDVVRPRERVRGEGLPRHAAEPGGLHHLPRPGPPVPGLARPRTTGATRYQI